MRRLDVLAAVNASSQMEYWGGRCWTLRVPGRKPVRTSTSKSAAAREAVLGARREAWDEVDEEAWLA